MNTSRDFGQFPVTPTLDERRSCENGLTSNDRQILDAVSAACIAALSTERRETGAPQNNKMQLASGGLMARFARLHQVAACS